MKSQRRADAREANAEAASAAQPISRRDFLKGAGVAVAVPVGVLGRTPDVPSEDGTPEQIHLTYGDDPARTVFISWASPARAIHARVLLHGHGGAHAVIPAVQRPYPDGMNGETVFTYHAKLDRLEPHASYRYSVTADNDSRRHAPFTMTFRTAPRGRVPFRWTSYGDLSTPVASWMMSSPQSR